MKITNPLDNILDTEAKIRILRFLFRTNAQWNGRQIAKEIGFAPATTHKALQGLNGEGILELRNVGKTHVYSLNEDNYVVSSMLRPLFSKESGALDNVINMIKRKITSSGIKKSIISAALFGSVVTRQDRPTSDIDLVVIVDNVKAKATAEKAFELIDKKISKDFGNTLSPYINTVVEFKAKFHKDIKVIKNILRSHRVIYGRRLEEMV